MGRALGAVDEDEAIGPVALCGGGDALDGVDAAEGVGDPRDGDEARARAQQPLVGFFIEVQIGGEGDGLEHGATALAEHLPRDDVGVVGVGADEDFVAGAEVSGKAEHVGDEVDAGGAAGGEDDLLRRGGVQEVGGAGAGLFVGFGGEPAQVVGAAVDVGVLLFVEAPLGVEDAEGFLGGGGAIEVDEGVFADRRVEDGEIRTMVHQLLSLRCSTMR